MLGFLKPKSVVIELCPYGFGCYYGHWAEMFGMQYFSLRLGESSIVSSSSETISNYKKHANVCVDVPRVIELVKRGIGSLVRKV